MKTNLKPESQIVSTTDSESTIGLDLGDRWSRYCIVDQAGTIAKEDRVRSTPEALQECFGKIRTARIVIEAGSHSPWGEPIAGKTRPSGDRGQWAQGATDL